MSKILYRYYTLYRPPMPSAIPKCTHIIRDYGQRKFVPDIEREAWGYVDCERELTPDEIAEYELMASKGNS